MPLYCENCGHSNEDSARLCQGCGREMQPATTGGSDEGVKVTPGKVTSSIPPPDSASAHVPGGITGDKISRCPFCNDENPPGAEFCAGCGKKLLKMTQCPSCGAGVVEGKKFCYKCGKPVTDTIKPSFNFKIPLIAGCVFLVLIVAAGILYFSVTSLLPLIMAGGDGTWINCFGNRSQNSYVDISGITLPDLNWTGSQRKANSPVVFLVAGKDEVYIVTGEGEPALICYDVNTGSEKWTYPFESNFIASCPSVINNKIYICLSDQNSSEVKLVSFDTESKIPVRDVFIGKGKNLLGVTGDKNNIYCGTFDDTQIEEGEFFCIGEANGEKKWSFRGKGSFVFPPSLKGDYIYVSDIYTDEDSYSEKSKLYALSSDSGKTLWTADIPGIAFLSSPAIMGNMIYITGGNREEDSILLYALDIETGNEKWHYELSEDVSSYDPLAGRVVVSEKENLVFIKDRESTIALEGDGGNKKWCNDKSGGPLLCTRDVLITCFEDGLFGVSPEEGKLLWVYFPMQDKAEAKYLPFACFSGNNLCVVESYLDNYETYIKPVSLRQVSEDRKDIVSKENEENLSDIVSGTGSQGGRGALEECESNLKNIATALEMYATDNYGDYPPSLSYLIADSAGYGVYIKTLPVCPACQESYRYESCSMPDNFSLFCGGGNAHISTQEVDEGYYPLYTSQQGIQLRGPVPDQQ